MGADHAISNSFGGVHLNGEKLKRFPSGVVVGFSGALALQNSIEEVLIKPETGFTTIDISTDDGSLLDVFNLLKETASSTGNGELLLAQNTTIVYMGNIAGWHRVKAEFHCIGNGAPVALGAMHVLSKCSPRRRIERSIEAAATHIMGVGVAKKCDYVEV